MRILTFIMFITSFTCLSSLAQAVDSSLQEQELRIAFCHTWILTHMASKDKTVPVPDDQATYLTFNSGGTYK